MRFDPSTAPQCSAEHLAKMLPEKPVDRARAKEAIRRMRAVRKAMIAAGLPLPPLRALGRTDERYGLQYRDENPSDRF